MILLKLQWCKAFIDLRGVVHPPACAYACVLLLVPFAVPPTACGLHTNTESQLGGYRTFRDFIQNGYGAKQIIHRLHTSNPQQPHGCIAPGTYCLLVQHQRLGVRGGE